MPQKLRPLRVRSQLQYAVELVHKVFNTINYHGISVPVADLPPENVMTMTAKISTAVTWTKPELVRLGQIADVAGPVSGTAQNTSKS